jgi:hypothetical protein
MMRKVLVIDYGLCNFHNLIELTKEGHQVWVSNSSKTGKEAPFQYYLSNGITILPDDIHYGDYCNGVARFVDEKGIDTILNFHPDFVVPHYWKTDLDYVGLNTRSAHTETKKLWCRNEVEKLGVRVPKFLNEITIPCVVKPKRDQGGIACIDRNTQLVLNEEQRQTVRFDSDHHYIEEYIDHDMEVNVDFTVSQGKYAIAYAQQTLGEGDTKLADSQSWWINKTGSARIYDEKDMNLILSNAEKILEWVASLGGSFQGHLTGLVKDGEYYFSEINARQETSNSIPIYCNGEEYLESLFNGKPHIISDARPWYQESITVIPKYPDAEYPFHLHEKHDVLIPCGLDIIDGKYRVSLQYRDETIDGRVGIKVIDKEIPMEFIEDMKASDFEVWEEFTSGK